MPIVATPEVGIPLPFDTTPEEITDFREKARALFDTVQDLISQGAEVEITTEDKASAHKMFAEKKLPSAKHVTPGAILNLEAILSEWDQEVLDVNRRLRNYVTNKLILESNDPDPKVRLKSLELLGKTSGVGLFAERIDVNVTHRSVADIEKELAKTLELYMGPVETVEATPVAIANIDLDEELGELPEEVVDDEQEEGGDGSESTD